MGDTHTAITERDPLMLNQRLMLMPSMVFMDMLGLMLMDTDHTDTDTHTATDTDTDTERDLLMLRPRLTQLSSTTLLPPVTYTVPTVSAVPAVKTVATVPAVHTYAGVHAVHTPVVNTVGSTVYYGKREAEADPALLYTGVHTPVHSVYSSPLVHHAYTVPAVHTATVAKAADHGVVGTYAGLVHSSHAGICLNNVGVQVP